LTTIVAAKSKAGSKLNSSLHVLLGLWLCAGAEAKAAVPLTVARIGAGPSLLHMTTGKETTWGTFGSIRFGAFQERLNLIAGLDVTAYHVYKSGSSQLPDDIDGNNVLAFLGYSKDAWSAWGGIGAGQMRIYDREGENKVIPHRSVSQAMEAGVSYDLYRAQYGKVDASATWHRIMPEKEWRSRYALTMIDCLQFEIGFKLLGW
jgi:hypothetical protein